jgi:hypothetical protein
VNTRSRTRPAPAALPRHARPPPLARLRTQTAALLKEKTFAELSGCAAQCTVQDTSFGNESVANWTTPTRDAARTSATECDLTDFPSPRFELTEPTILNTGDSFCSAEFIRLRVSCDAIRAGGVCARGRVQGRARVWLLRHTAVSEHLAANL